MKINDGRLNPKKEKTFGVKKPFKGLDKNRKGNKKATRLKPKYSAKNKKLFTAEDGLYLEWLQSTSYHCLVCGGSNGIEWHHVKRDSADKKNHSRLIPLCGVEHHRLGTKLSAHGTPKKFREAYPVEVQLEVAKSIYEDYLSSIV